MKGILLAGGSGTRMGPTSLAACKQLLPVFDKPLVFYSLCTLMLAGIRDVLVIRRPNDAAAFWSVLGDGSNFGMSITYADQRQPKGVADAYLIADKYLGGESSCLVLGDNLFHGHHLGTSLSTLPRSDTALIFAYWVADPRDYAVVELDASGRCSSIEEKPSSPKSNLAVPGIYFLPPDAPARAASVRPSARGELEIVDVLKSYLQDERLVALPLPRGALWMDVGTPERFSDASAFVRLVSERQGLSIACPEEIAFSQGWISHDQLMIGVQRYAGSDYGSYLETLGKRNRAWRVDE